MRLELQHLNYFGGVEGNDQEMSAKNVEEWLVEHKTRNNRSHGRKAYEGLTV